MRLIGIVVSILLVVAVIAVATKPGEEQFDAMLRQAIEKKIATTDVGTQGDAVATIALVGCKLRPSDCFQLIRESMDVRFEEHLFYTTAHIEGFKRKAECKGAFTRFFCKKLLDE